jgi:hypothetical protein
MAHFSSPQEMVCPPRAAEPHPINRFPYLKQGGRQGKGGVGGKPSAGGAAPQIHGFMRSLVDAPAPADGARPRIEHFQWNFGAGGRRGRGRQGCMERPAA